MCNQLCISLLFHLVMIHVKHLTLLFLGIQKEEAKAKQSLKMAAKKGETASCKVLAREIVRSRKAVNKIRVAQAQMKSVEYNMANQLGMSEMIFMLL